MKQFLLVRIEAKPLREQSEQDFSILNEVIGMDLKSLQFNRGTIKLDKEQILTGNGNLGITFFDRELINLKY